jgi:DNA-binding NarL/FixJ family response regulator
VVVVSASDRSSDVIRAIDLGAMGFVPKRASNEMLFEALHLVLSGGIYVPPMSLGAGVTSHASLPPETSHALQTVRDQAAASEYRLVPPSYESLGLTPRQRQVLALLLEGKPNKIIARELGLSVETVKDHVAAVLRSLGVSSRTQAVLAIAQLQRQQVAAAQEGEDGPEPVEQ